MNWLKTAGKGALGVLTFLVAYLATNPHIVLNLVPDNIEQITVGSLIAGALVAAANWLKHRNK